MLVLSRKKSEKVFILVNGKTIEVMVVELRGDKCRLGFTGDEDVKFYREEVLDEINQKGKKSDA